MLIIDMQEGFIISGRIKNMAENLLAHIKENRYGRVIASRFINGPASPYTRKLHWRGMTKENDTELYRPLSPYYDRIFIKQTNSALTEELKAYLAAEEIKLIFLAGLNTECCVLATASALFDAGYDVKVLVKFCGSNEGNSYHRAGLKALRSLIGGSSLIE